MKFYNLYLRFLGATVTTALLLCLHPMAQAQEPAKPAESQPQTAAKQPNDAVKTVPPVAGNPNNPAVNIDATPDKRAFGVLPNYRTAEGSAPYQPLTVKQKFTIARKDSFDTPVLGTTAVFAGISQLEGSSEKVYGGGVKGYVYRYGINYADQVIGNFFPEAIVPTIFHTDPRYFRKGEGSIAGRTFYAVSRIFVCKNNNGNLTFNVNEFVGNEAAAATVSLYHPMQRRYQDIDSEAFSFLVSDTLGQIAKEFWPDVKRRFTRHRQRTSTP